MQNIGETSVPFLATLNPDHTPKNTLLKWSIGNQVPSVGASKALLELDLIQGKRGIWFCSAYQGEHFTSWKKMRNTVQAETFLDNFLKPILWFNM